jgi:hypothetical protein
MFSKTPSPPLAVVVITTGAIITPGVQHDRPGIAIRGRNDHHRRRRRWNDHVTRERKTYPDMNVDSSRPGFRGKGQKEEYHRENQGQSVSLCFLHDRLLSCRIRFASIDDQKGEKGYIPARLFRCTYVLPLPMEVCQNAAMKSWPGSGPAVGYGAKAGFRR